MNTTFDLSFYGFPFCQSLVDIELAKSAEYKNVSITCSCGKRMMAPIDSAAELLQSNEIECKHAQAPRQEQLYYHEEQATVEEFIDGIKSNGLNKRWL